MQIDLSDRKRTAEAIEEIRGRLDGGRLDALVNNAGVSPKGEEGGAAQFSDHAGNALDGRARQFPGASVTGAGLFAELANARGLIVDITSVVGSKVHPFAGSTYATSKATLSSLTREMAADFAPHGIRVNAIAPGGIITDILSPGAEERFVPLIPMRRFGRPEEVAAVVAFLCSEAASYVAGEEINVGGG